MANWIFFGLRGYMCSQMGLYPLVSFSFFEEAL